MGKRYVPHSDLCGCERCARQADSENPRQVFDAIEDPDACDYCGMDRQWCSCGDIEDDFDDFDEVDASHV